MSRNVEIPPEKSKRWRFVFIIGAASLLAMAIYSNLSCSPARAPVATPPTESLTLTVRVEPSGSGIIIVSPLPGEEGKYTKGTVVTLTARPVSEYAFFYWKEFGIGIGGKDSISVVMDSDKYLAAFFLPIAHAAPPTPVPVEPTGTPPSRDPPIVSITSPKTFSAVSWQQQIRGTSQRIVSDPKLNIYLLIYPIETNGPWWVQPKIIIDPQGNWVSTGYFGRDPKQFPEDINKSFNMIAIATPSTLEPGQQWYSLPEYIARSQITEAMRR